MNISSNAELVVRKSAGHYVLVFLKEKYSEYMADCLLCFMRSLEAKLSKLEDKKGQYSSRFSKKYKIPGSDLCLRIQATIILKDYFSKESILKIQRIEVSVPELNGLDVFNLAKAIDETVSFVFEKQVLGASK